jgi:type II secretory ATPase GspE/PulE/Tfp pilus assembly ATPase PilB-like protein
MPEILFRRETSDEQLAMGATFLDDLDLVMGRNDKLCMISIKNGRQVCQQCGHTFDESSPKLKRAEVSLAPGSPPVILHAGCENFADRRKIFQVFRGLEIRREMAKTVKASASLFEAAKSATKKIFTSKG